jgi:hypothetical protein
MLDPIKVTFDHNTYEFVVSPEKAWQFTETKTKKAYNKINAAIKSGFITPFISETILTIETINKEDRKRVLASKDRIVSNVISEQSFDNRCINSITVKPNTEIYPTNTDHFKKYLPKALELGFQILPSYRFGKISNPAINPEWYYLPETTEHLEIPNKFSRIVQLIENEGFGFASLSKLLSIDKLNKKLWIFYLDQYSGNQKKLQKCIAEWSDADSVAIHIASGIKYFCTYDGSGKKDKSSSVFGIKMKSILEGRYDIEFVTPVELLNKFVC